jgi:hypothetical protein
LLDYCRTRLQAVNCRSSCSNEQLKPWSSPPMAPQDLDGLIFMPVRRIALPATRRAR